MRTLVIADIHHRITQAQALIDRVPHDKCILLGDYFDQFHDGPKEAEHTALWLRDKVLTNPKIVPLTGNHDQYYAYPKAYTYLQGSGYSPEKYDATRAILHDEHWQKFQYYHIHDGFVFSHAGLSVHLWKQMLWNFAEEDVPNPVTIEFFDKLLGEFVAKNRHQASVLHPAPLFAPGWDRGGLERYGGITWGDFGSFAPIKGINQIFGHTPRKVPTILTQNQHGTLSTYGAAEYARREETINKNATSLNLDLDTHNSHYLVIEDGKLDIFDRQTGLSFRELKDYAIPDNPLHGLA
jgi:hypothetical protein